MSWRPPAERMPQAEQPQATTTPQSKALPAAAWLLLAGLLGGCGDDRVEILPGAAQSYRLPDSNGLSPSQCWYGLGSGADGSIYIGASDHLSNAALFRLAPGAERFVAVGDARSASQAADNWREGETVEKFHVRPTELGGRIYLGGLDYSFYNAGYARERGFHWYAYDPAEDSFTDLSAAEPDGIASPLQLESLAADRANGLLYGAGVPRGHLLRYEPASGRSSDLGRPAALEEEFVEFDSFIWLGGDGRVYFAIEGRGELFDHVHYYDPKTQSFGERRDWRFEGPGPEARDPKRAAEASEEDRRRNIKAPRAARIPKLGQCVADAAGRRCYMADNNARIYRFSEPAGGEPRWDYLGSLRFPAPHEAALLVTRSFQLSPDERHIYLVNDRYRGAPGVLLHRFDIASGESRVLADLAELDPASDYRDFNLHCGHDAWDAEGRFYIGSFGLSGEGGNVVVTRIDPGKFVLGD